MDQCWDFVCVTDKSLGGECTVCGLTSRFALDTKIGKEDCLKI